MTLQSIRDGLIDGENKAVVYALVISLVLLAVVSTANAAVDLGAALHDATCRDHAGEVVARTGR